MKNFFYYFGIPIVMTILASITLFGISIEVNASITLVNIILLIFQYFLLVKKK